METKSSLVDNEFITFKNSQGLSARGTLLKVSHNHIVFETYNPYSIVQLSEVLSNVNICRFNETIYVGRAVVSNLINTGLLLIVSATLVDPWIETVKPSRLPNVKTEADKFLTEWNQLNNNVLPDYQVSVNRMRSFLTDMNRWVRQFDSLKDDDEVIEKIAEPLLSNLAGLIFTFEAESKKINPSQIGICKRFAQQELHPLVMQSPFGHRAFAKPLGYAGDYEMVNMMLRSPYEGETTYAKLLNLFLLKAGPAEAHRNRIDILVERLKSVAEKAASEGRRAQIFNFACGPAIELQRFIASEKISENCDFILLDFSKETLDYTYDKLQKEKIKSGNEKVGIKLVHKSVNDVLKNAVGHRDKDLEENKDLDLIYCAGLFDYLSDRVCSKLLNLFFSQLRPEGILLATNVHSNNPIKSLMEHVFEWYLTYRDEAGFYGLIDLGEKTIYADKTGFNIFLETQKSPT